MASSHQAPWLTCSTTCQEGYASSPRLIPSQGPSFLPNDSLPDKLPGPDSASCSELITQFVGSGSLFTGRSPFLPEAVFLPASLEDFIRAEGSLSGSCADSFGEHAPPQVPSPSQVFCSQIFGLISQEEAHRLSELLQIATKLPAALPV